MKQSTKRNLMAKIWIIGGTTETFETAEKLLKNKKDIIITVATKYGLEEFAKFSPYLLQKSMDESQMEEFCKEYNIEKIADISHPYAQNVSKNALEVSKKLNIPYFRYERQNSDISYENNAENIFYVDSHSEAIKLAKEKNFQKILITTGINNAFDYVNANFPQLYIRILPRSEQIKMLEDAAFPSKNIIAIQGPFSLEMNIATIKYCNADVLITKQSGASGGYDEKIQASISCDISCIVIKRPKSNGMNFENFNEFMQCLINN